MAVLTKVFFLRDFLLPLDPPPSSGQLDRESFLASREGCHSRTTEQKRQILGLKKLGFGLQTKKIWKTI